MSIEENLNNVDINILNVGFENNIFNANDLNNNNFQNSPSYPLDILMDFNEIKKNFENVLSTNCSSGTILNETDNGRKKHKVINTSKMGRKRGKRDKENERKWPVFASCSGAKIARRSNQSILKEISPEYSLEGLMLKLKLQYLVTLCEELTHLKRP